MTQQMVDEHSLFLSTLAPTRRELGLVRALVVLSLLVFALLAPFAKVPLPKVWPFIPIYESALVINDLITALLLFGQYRILRSQALFMLACGYLFTACMAAIHAMTFPGLFAEGGLLGAGPQTTAWMYMFWHAGFPLFVVAYAWLRNAPQGVAARQIPPPLMLCATVLLVLVSTLVTTAGQDWLPKIMRGNHYAPAMVYVIGSVWLLSLVALIQLWRNRERSVLDLWLMVVVGSWLLDIALAVMLNAGRFDLGFYTGRIYGLLAASFVLAMLLLENGQLYARMVDLHRQERQKNAENSELYARLVEQHQREQQKNAKLMQLAQHIAQGDLTLRVEADAYQDDLGNALNEMVDNLRTMTDDVGEGVTVLAHSASTILISTGQIALSAAETASAMTQAVTTLAETKQTAQVSSDKAHYVSEAARKAAEVSQAGRASVDDAVDGMQRIHEQMEQIAASIVLLSTHTQTIGEIIATVNDLADQSNLLAVNAAIEAAKAGEQGLGFVVVAQEVKNLARQSKQATVQVRGILSDICKAIDGAVHTTEQGADAVAQGMKQSQAAGDSIRQLNDSITASAQAASQIAVSAQQQLAGMDQLVSAMHNIRDAAARNADSTRQTEAVAMSLHELGVKLKELMARYRV